MEQRLSLVTLGVSDLGRCRAFYRAMGWRESGASNESVAFFQAGGIVLALWGSEALAEDAGVPSEGSGFRRVALAYNTRTLEEVAVVLAEAEAAGGTILKPAQDTFWGGHAGYFEDPDGHLWEVAWNPGFPLDEAGNVRAGNG